MLDAAVCQLDHQGHLTWLDADLAGRFLRRDVVPDNFQALDQLVDGGASRALNQPIPVTVLRPQRLELRADAQTGLIILRCLNGAQGVVVAPSAANDAGAETLAQALAERRMCLFRQPIVSSHDQRVVRWECLSRLITVEGQIVSPVEFIPAAEAAGLVGELDIETLNLALASLKRESDVHLAINVSAATIADHHAKDAYQALLASARDLAPRLTVEITETIAIHDIDAAAHFGHAIRGTGARLALDDFGEGHTSFRSLRALPLDEIKIDGAYVANIHDRADNQAFVAAIDRLARDLGMDTVAERVETAEEADILKSIGVSGLQGYFYGKPRSAGK